MPRIGEAARDILTVATASLISQNNNHSLNIFVLRLVIQIRFIQLSPFTRYSSLSHSTYFFQKK